MSKLAWENEEIRVYYWNSYCALVEEKHNFYSDGQNITYLMDIDTLVETYPDMEC